MDGLPADAAGLAPEAREDAAGLLLEQLVRGFEEQKAHGERALAQLGVNDWHRSPDPGTNSVAVLVRHLEGNMRSRWRDFLTSDGEKPDRDRENEFAASTESGDALMARWHDGWGVALKALHGLHPADLGRTVTIRGEPHTVARALVRQLTHYAQHVGQIVLLAKHLRGSDWRTLTELPPTESGGGGP